MTDRIDTLRTDWDRELRARSGGYPAMIRRAIHVIALTLIGVVMFFVFIAMLGDFPMAQGLQLGAAMIAPLAFIAFLSRPRR